MATSTESSATLAVLIDAVNAKPAIIKGLIEEVAKLGRATVRRIYGDWTKPNLNPWKDTREAVLDRQARRPSQYPSAPSTQIVEEDVPVEWTRSLSHSTKF
jgi:hypothetical protein